MTAFGGHDKMEGDTSREARRVQFAALRKLTPTQRLALADDLSALVRSMAREGLKRRHPGATEEELDALFAELVLGRALAQRVWTHRRARRDRQSP